MQLAKKMGDGIMDHGSRSQHGKVHNSATPGILLGILGAWTTYYGILKSILDYLFVSYISLY